MLKRYPRHKKVLLAAVVGILLGGVLLFLRQSGIWRHQMMSGPLSQSVILNKADIEVKKMELSETEAGELAWNLKAEKAQVYEKEGVAYLQGISLEYLLNEGEEVILTSERGRIGLAQKNIFLQGNVDASSHQIQLKTNTLSWNREKRMLMTEDLVWLRRENIEITGEGMVADIGLGKIKLNKNIRTVIH